MCSTNLLTYLLTYLLTVSGAQEHYVVLRKSIIKWVMGTKEGQGTVCSGRTSTVSQQEPAPGTFSQISSGPLQPFLAKFISDGE